MGTKIWLALVTLGVAAWSCNKDVNFTSQSLDKVAPKVIVDQEFAAGVIGDGHTVYQPQYGLVEDTVTLREKPPVKASLTQVMRTQKADEFAQGHDGSQVTEDFTVAVAGKLDLLVVVDNSGSMESEQLNLATKLGALTKYLKTVNWQIGVITTDSTVLRNGGKPIRSTDASADVDFFNAVSNGTGGSGDERGITQAYGAISGCNTVNHAWLRPDAPLAVLFLSDEDSSEGIFGVSTTDLINRMKACRQPAQLKAYALTWTTGCPKDLPDQAETEGTRYLRLVTEFGGVSGSICEDFTNSLEAISRNVSKTVSREFSLQYQPEAGSVTVEADGQPYLDFEIDGKKLLVKNADGSFATLKVSYTHGSVAKFDRVTLSEVPAVDTLKVSVEGTVLDPTKTTYDPLTKEVFFVNMPADDAKIKIEYRTAGTLVKDFDFGGRVPQGETLEVSVNGTVAQGWTMDEATRVLTLQDAPDDGAAVSVTVRPADSRVMRYPAGATQDLSKVEEITAQDKSTGDVLAVQLEGVELVFDEVDVADGRAVTVIYNYGDAGTVLTHELAYTPIDGTVDIRGVGPENCVEGVVVQDRTVSYTCDAAELDEVEINYKYVAQRFTTFKIEGDFPAECQVQVYVDGGAVSAWHREGDQIIINEDQLKIDSKVRVIATVYATK